MVRKIFELSDLLFSFLYFVFFNKAQSQVNEIDLEETTRDKETSSVEYVLDEPVNIKDGPVKFEIVGDTAHLFEPEDFEKKEVFLLHENKDDTNKDTSKLNTTEFAFDSTSNQTDGNNQTQTTKGFNRFTHPECNGYNTTPHRDLNLVFRINGSSLTHLMAGSDPNDCFTVLFYVILVQSIWKLY